ncbi:acyl-CoA dehydrogenase family protein [Rhodococcus rhodochrous]|uniref:acyl-CoA dehydrogenase family protein n=1 Tax=Rhodococcus rhodochrous TaxID=1829 RepID=UPI0002D3D665|nr:acyl-CoA dehydrogenase family protein [Rhodococcus rhodochrous]
MSHTTHTLESALDFTQTDFSPAGGPALDQNELRRRVHRQLLGDFSDSVHVQRARELVPVLKERAHRQWEHERVFDETIADMQEAGLFQMLQPRRYGGTEATPIESFEVAATLAEGDPSVGWVLAVVGGHAFHLAYFDDRAQAEVWSDDTKMLISSPYAPCTAKRVDGGFLLSGRWSFSSGSDHCGWTLLGANIEGEPPAPPGPVGTHVMLLPRSDYSIVHNWKVHGLRATGSNDIVVENAFIPDHRSLTWESVFDRTAPGLQVNDGLLYRLPFFQVFSRATQPPTALGALKGMADALVERFREKGRGLQDPIAALALSKTYSAIDEMKGRLFANYASLIAQAEGEITIPASTLEQYRFQAAHIAPRCAELATELYRVAGGTGIYEDRPFGRYLADIQATQTHALNNFPQRALEWMTVVGNSTPESEVRHPLWRGQS